MGSTAGREGKKKRGYRHQARGDRGDRSVRKSQSPAVVATSVGPQGQSCELQPGAVSGFFISEYHSFLLLLLQFPSFSSSSSSRSLPWSSYTKHPHPRHHFEIPRSLSISLTLPFLVWGPGCSVFFLSFDDHKFIHSTTHIYLWTSGSPIPYCGSYNYHTFWEIHCYSGFKLIRWIERK